MALAEPRAYRFEGGVLRIAPVGRYGAEQYVDLVDAALADPACPGRVALLADSTRSTAQRSTPELRWIVREIAERADRIGRVALLAPTDVRFGLSRVAAAYGAMEGMEYEVFREEADALAWLAEATDPPDAHPPEKS